MAELEADPEWRAAEAEREARLAEQEAAYAEAEAPLLAALAGAGLEVESVWDLVNRDDEGIARSLSFRKAAPAWPVIVGLYRSTIDSFGLQPGLAVATAGTVTDETVDELVAEARRPEHGESRFLLLLGLRRLRTPVARQALEGLMDDPDLGDNAAKHLKGKRT